VIEAHIAAVGAADATMLAALYPPDGRLYDPAGTAPGVGRAAIAGLFARALTGPLQPQPARSHRQARRARVRSLEEKSQLGRSR
jgi:hypothetical protein